MKSKIIVAIGCLLFVSYLSCFGQLPRAFNGNPSIQRGATSRQINNQDSSQFYDSEGILTNIEVNHNVYSGDFYTVTGYGQSSVNTFNRNEALVLARRFAREGQIREYNDKLMRKEIELTDNLTRKSNELNSAFFNANTATNRMIQLANHTLKKEFQEVEDPWRKIEGKTVYVNASGRFTLCGGKILQTTRDGVLLDRMDGNTIFIKNYPKLIPDEQFVWNISAVPAEPYSYNTVLGASKTVYAYDYGIPCKRPADADVIEAKAREFSPEEIAAINQSAKDAVVQLEIDQKDFEDAKEQLQSFYQGIENERQALVDKQRAAQDEKQQQAQAKKQQAQAKVLKSNQDMADKGDEYGLLRMGERYRDGDGVPKDLTKARDYLSKAAAAGSPTAAEELEKLNQAFPAIKSEPAN